MIIYHTTYMNAHKKAGPLFNLSYFLCALHHTSCVHLIYEPEIGYAFICLCYFLQVPSYISRSVAGSYNNEVVTICALIFTFYLYIKVRFWSTSVASFLVLCYISYLKCNAVNVQFTRLVKKRETMLLNSLTVFYFFLFLLSFLFSGF